MIFTYFDIFCIIFLYCIDLPVKTNIEANKVYFEHKVNCYWKEINFIKNDFYEETLKMKTNDKL